MKKLVGNIANYFEKIGVAVVEAVDDIKVGDKIIIEGGDVNFEETVASMQIDRKNIMIAKKGQAFGLKTSKPVKKGFKVFKA